MRTVDRLVALRYPAQRTWAAFRVKYLMDFVFVHINKTGGSSIEKALGIPFQHRTAIELRELLGERRWRDRFSFAFVRNPWDKVASHYHYRVQTNQTGLADRPISFNEWVVRAYGERDPQYHDQPRMFLPQTVWLGDRRGAQIVDYVGRFERLVADFAEVCRRLGMGERSLPHTKKSRRPPYRDLYDARSRRIVREHFADDLERFGYVF